MTVDDAAPVAAAPGPGGPAPDGPAPDAPTPDVAAAATTRRTARLARGAHQARRRALAHLPTGSSRAPAPAAAPPRAVPGRGGRRPLLAHRAEEDEPRAHVAPAWGWRRPGAGRHPHVEAGNVFAGTTVQMCGLFPFVQGSGVPPIGVPMGRHLLSAEVVCLDPLEWVTAGFITNPGVFLLGQPGVGKSSFAKRLITGLAGYGVPSVIPGEPKGEYSALVEHLGGQVIRVGRGLDRLNPLDAGPLGEAARRASGDAGEVLRQEVRSRRLVLLTGLATVARRGPLTNGEEVALAGAVDLLADRLDVDPTVPDVLAVLAEGPAELRAMLSTPTEETYRAVVSEIVFTLRIMTSGSLAGLFDGPSSATLDATAPAVSVDISRLAGAGESAVAGAMLCSWAWSSAMLDAAAFTGHRRRYNLVLDELWRPLRVSPGLVDHADQLTRLNRAKGASTVFITHSMADLEALAKEEDRAKARGFVERCGITVLAALPQRELARVDEVVPMSAAERDLVASWSSPTSWHPAAAHPGRGKYLIKTGARLGVPVELTYVGVEHRLYDTDQALVTT